LTSPSWRKSSAGSPSPGTKLTDTLTLSRLIYADLDQIDYIQLRKNPQYIPGALIGKHSLKAWGYRLGELKGDFSEKTDWKAWSPEMQAYCEQDVRVECLLFQKFEALHYSPVAIQLEHEFQEVIFKQEQFGFAFDEPAAVKLLTHLTERKEKLTEELQQAFEPTVEMLKTPAYYLGDGRQFPTKGAAKKAKAAVIEAGPLRQKLIPFNPGSTQQISDRLKLLGWTPKHFTPTGSPKINDEILDEVLETLNVPQARLLNEYRLVDKRIQQLAGGPKSWMQNVKNGRIHQSVTTNGAVTGRCTHKIVVNVPKAIDSVPYGKECRALFCADPGHVLVGADASGLELRCLGHYLAPYDAGAFAKEVVEGDIHTRNTIALGLEANKSNRNIAKTFIYGYLYGAGNHKIGTITGVTPEEIERFKQEEKKRWTAAVKYLRKNHLADDPKSCATIVKGDILRTAFEANTPALKFLKAGIDLKILDPRIEWNGWKIAAARELLEQGGFAIPRFTGYLKGLDGRLLRIRHAHAALNTLLQSAGAVLVKRATVIHYQKLLSQGYTWGKDWANCGHFHDEVQVQARPELAEIVGKSFVEAIKEAGTYFNFKCPVTGEFSIGSNWASTH
jgi:DNA polymerase-1